MIHNLPFWLQGLTFAPDDKSSGGTNGTKDKQKPTESEGQDDSDDSADDTEDADGEGKKAEKPKSKEKSYSKEEVEEIVQDRLKRDRESSAKKAEKELTDAQKKKLRDAKSFEELSDTLNSENATQAATISGLETERDDLKGKLELANKAMESYIAVLREGHPDSVLKLLKGLSFAEQLEWLAENRPETTGDDDGGKKPFKKIEKTAKSDKQKTPSEEETEQARLRQARSVSSNF